MSMKSKNLIICMTPLQIIIALNIIKNNKCDYEVCVLSYTANSKYDYYCQLLKENGVEVKFFLLNNKNNINRLINVFKIKKMFSGKSYLSVYVASIDNANIYTVLSCIEFKNFFTFDDGTANIFKNSSYYVVRSNNFIMKLLGVNWDVNKVKNKTELHYTIYKDFSNIVENTSYLKLFSSRNYVKNKNKNKNKHKNLYLGQAFDGENKFLSLIIFKRLNQKVKDLLYYPHPREANINLDENVLVKSDLVVEDYILNLLNGGYHVNLYSFCSTAAFNLASVENVSVYFVRTEETRCSFFSVYKFIESHNMNLMEV